MYTIKRATIREVAAQAGVSTQTVSRVINESAGVSPETRERVQQIIDRMGYQPSAVARSLIGRRTYTIGVVGSGLEYFGPSHTLTGIEKQAVELGFSVLLSLLHNPGTPDVGDVLRYMISHRVEGIIWAVPEIGDNRRWLHELRLPNVPVVFLSMQPQPDLPVVSLANRPGSRLAVRHLLERGYRNVGLITGPMTWWEARERRLGWEEALISAGLPAESRQVAEGDWTAESGERAYTALRAAFPEMDAVFASNDQMALGVLHSAWASGVRVPGDLAVVGFDDIPESAYFVPSLTTVRQESTELGCSAVRVLARLIAAWQETGRISSVESIWLQPELIIRESTSREPSEAL